MVPRCCPIGPCRRKYDLSRAGVGSVPGRPVGCRGDPAGLPSFAGIAGWLAAAVPAALSSCTFSRSSDAPGSRNCRCKTPTRSPASGKSTAVTPLLWPSHPSRAWTTALWLCPLNGAAMKKTPIVSAIGVSLSNYGPALPEPRQTAAAKKTSSLANGAHPKNHGASEADPDTGFHGAAAAGLDVDRSGQNSVSSVGFREPLGRVHAPAGYARTKR